MNRLIFLLPAQRIVHDENVPAQQVCDSLIAIAEFLDYETCALYWDEDAYKNIRGKIEGDDKTSLGLRRNRLQRFTHYKYLPAYGDGLKAFLSVEGNSEEISEEILGRYALHRVTYPDEPTAMVCHPNVHPIGRIIIFSGDAYVAAVDADEHISDNLSAAGWFAENRCPQRIFNFDAPKHKADESYMVDGIEVSPLVGTEAQIKDWLHNAIGVDGGRRLMHYAQATRTLYIFSYENRKDTADAPVYHGHQVNIVRKAELNRLPSKYMKKIKALTGIDIRI